MNDGGKQYPTDLLEIATFFLANIRYCVDNDVVLLTAVVL